MSIHVYDHNNIRSAVLIGEALMPLQALIYSSPSKEFPINIELKDKKGKKTGQITIVFICVKPPSNYIYSIIYLFIYLVIHLFIHFFKHIIYLSSHSFYICHTLFVSLNNKC
jgi:hypothetical protein